MKIKDIVKKVHWFSSSTLAIVMLIIFTVLFVISFSRVLNQKEVVVKEVVASAVEDSNKTAERKEKVPTKSDESNKSEEIDERPKLEDVLPMHKVVVAGDEEETEELAPYQGEESYAIVRNKLLSEGWLLLERSEFAEVKPGKEPKSGGGKTVVCKEATVRQYEEILRQRGQFQKYKYRDVLRRFCWKEKLVRRKITKKSKELTSDRHWQWEDGFMVDFVHPTNKEFDNKVRHIFFSICNIGSYYECSDKPESYLEMNEDRILTKAKAESEYLRAILYAIVLPNVDTD
jgi:hypothetical protein